jgi:F-type H+-transporting ATPase subunit gamma
MSGLKELRSRIGSIKTTRQVTSAMKMVSAAKLKKAQDTVIHFRPYAKSFDKILFSVLSGADNLDDLKYTSSKTPENVLMVLISSNRGLCGGFNSSVTNFALNAIRTDLKKQFQNKKVSFLTIGKQGERLLKNHKINVSGQKNDVFGNLTYENASEIASGLISDFTSGVYDRIELVYNEFINAAQYEQRREVFLPLQITSADRLPGDAIFEPSKTEILEDMIPWALKILFYKVLIFSFAAEHGARMTAMHQATDNATELLGELSLQYNKARQAAITGEILEITGGAEALRK